MKTKKASNTKKSHTAQFSFPCGDFQKMAEKMETFCRGEGNAIDCCSIMRRMMGQGKGVEVKETKETQKQPEGGENG